MNKDKGNAYATDMLDAGVDSLFGDNGPQYSMVFIADITVKKQVRETFESADHTFIDFAANIRKRGVLQPIIIRPIDGGYELVAGERRLRASLMAGMEHIPAIIRELSDDEAADVQFAENIHRLNLLLFEEAKKLQKDIDEEGGDIEKVMQKNDVSRSWISKRLSLLNLSDAAKRLITEDISADIEVINTVKVIEKLDPVAASELVDDLKETSGRGNAGNAREMANKVKDQVKPPKPPKEPGEKKGGKKPSNETGPAVGSIDGNEVYFHYAPEVRINAEETLNDLYTSVVNSQTAKAVLDSLSNEHKEAITLWLDSFYEAGTDSRNIDKIVLQGLSKGTFAQSGAGAFALAAFLQGVDREARFSLLNVLGSVKG